MNSMGRHGPRGRQSRALARAADHTSVHDVGDAGSFSSAHRRIVGGSVCSFIGDRAGPESVVDPAGLGETRCGDPGSVGGGALNESRKPFHVVVAGAGVAALETALGLRELAGQLVRVELVAPEAEFTYRPLAVAEPFQTAEARRFPLDSLVTAAGATLRCDGVAGVEPAQKRVRLL